MFRYIISTLVLGLFLFYSILTIVFVSPSNFFNISLTESGNTFCVFFNQKWEFFAPPPNFNDRIYYVFENKKIKNDNRIYEILNPILTEKADKAPFNVKADILDYLISNSYNNICDILIKSRKNKIYEYKKKNQIKTESEIFLIVREDVKNSNSFKTLGNYSKYIAKCNKLNYSNYKVSLKLTRKKINKFVNRNLTNSQIEELIFESEF